MPIGVPKQDGSGGGTGNIGRGGCVVPQATRKGQNPKKTNIQSTTTKTQSTKRYTKISNVPAKLRSVPPTVGGKAIALSLSQANKLAELLDNTTEEKAKAEFRKLYIVKGGKWMKTKNEQLLYEAWSKIPGSYEETQTKIRAALNKSSAFSNDKYELGIEATFKDEVIIRNYQTEKYYRADWKETDGEIKLDNIEEVEFEVAIKKVNESKEVTNAVREETQTKSLNELILTPIFLNEVTEDGKMTYKGKVDVAQKADVWNRNQRKYTSSVLKEATENLKGKMAEYGPLLMDYEHRVKEGKNYRDLRETVALINDVGFDEEKKAISLNEITFVDTQAGKDIVALIEGGAQLQVSQRAVGTSEKVKTEDGKAGEIINSLVIDGWDFVPPGEASIKDAKFEFKVLTEGEINNMPDEKVLSADETKEVIQTSITEVKEEITASIIDTLKEAGLLVNEDEDKDEEDTEIEKGGDTDAEDEDVDNPLLKEIENLRAKVDEGSTQLAEYTKKDQLQYLSTVGQKLLQEEITKDDYKRFSDEYKKVLLENVNPVDIYGKVNLQDKEAILSALKEILLKQVGFVDSTIAASKLEKVNYPVRGNGGDGIVNVEVNEQTPNMEYISKLTEMVEDELSLSDTWVMSKDHHAMKALDEILVNFDNTNYKRLLNEANEEVTQSDIGGKIASIARVVIPVAWRRMTALQIVDVGTMTQRIEDIKIARWNPAETTDVEDDISTIEIAEGGTIPTGGIQYTNYPLYAIRKALETSITPEAIATTKGTPMKPVADSIAGLAIDVSHRIDRLLWQIMITQAQLYAGSYSQVTDYKKMIEVDSTDVWQFTTDDTTVIDGGVLRYEWKTTQDVNGNPTGAKLNKLYDTPTATLQDVDVREAADDHTALVYSDDYSINWADGTITLTAAGVVKEASNGLEAKFTYSNATGIVNAKFWSTTPPAGVSLYDHLINLRQQVGQTKVLIGNRNYASNFMATNLEAEDLISSGPQFTEAGRTPAEIMDRFANVMNYAGLEPIKTSAIPSGWAIVGVKGACVYRVQTPWSMKGPVTDKGTGIDYYIADEFSANDVPVNGKLALVVLTDL